MTTLHFRSSYDPYDVMRVVAKFYFTPARQLRGPSRCASVVLPRHVAMYLLRKHTNLSLEQVGAMMGRRDHSTVYYAVRDTTNLLGHDQDLRQQVRQIEEILTSSRFAN